MTVQILLVSIVYIVIFLSLAAVQHKSTKLTLLNPSSFFNVLLKVNYTVSLSKDKFSNEVAQHIQFKLEAKFVSHSTNIIFFTEMYPYK